MVIVEPSARLAEVSLNLTRHLGADPSCGSLPPPLIYLFGVFAKVDRELSL